MSCHNYKVGQVHEILFFLLNYAHICQMPLTPDLNVKSNKLYAQSLTINYLYAKFDWKVHISADKNWNPIKISIFIHFLTSWNSRLLRGPPKLVFIKDLIRYLCTKYDFKVKKWYLKKRIVDTWFKNKLWTLCANFWERSLKLVHLEVHQHKASLCKFEVCGLNTCSLLQNGGINRAHMMDERPQTHYTLIFPMEWVPKICWISK